MQSVETLNDNFDLDSALEEAVKLFSAANPQSKRLNQEAAEVMPGGNTRTVLHFDPFPLTFVEASGSTLVDADGHRLLDLMGEYTAGLFGHSDPVIQAAIEAALRKGIVLGGPNRIETRFARAICDRFPAIDRIRFCNSGTEANIYALSAARAFTGCDDVIVMQGGYHGGVLYFAGPCPLNLPMPFHQVTYNNVTQAAEKIRSLGSSLAAVIVEPMLGGAGCIPGTADFLQSLRLETEKVGALLIFDEVMTSRLAPGGIHGLLDITPDLVTLGKYVGGGLTFGAFGGRRDIMDRFDPRRADAWPHAGTFNNNVLTMTAGMTGLTEIYTEDALAALNARGELLRQELRKHIEKRTAPVRITGMGSMTSYHFSRHEINSPAEIPVVSAGLKSLIHLDLIARGYYVAQRGMINLSLPVTEADIHAFVEAFDNVLEMRAGVIDAAVPE